MPKETTPSFIIEIEMKPSLSISSAIEKELNINRLMYNASLGELLKREKQMKQTKTYKKSTRSLRAVNKKLSSSDKMTKKELKKAKTTISNTLKSLRENYGLTEYSIHSFVPSVRDHFANKVNAGFAQKTATRAWKAFEKKLFGKSKQVHFKRKGMFFSFEGKTNTTGWRYHDRQVVYQKDTIPLLISKNDTYLLEALHYLESGQTFSYLTKKGERKKAPYRVKYVRIVKKVIRGKNRYYAQLVCSGFPPPKRDKNGNPKHQLGQGRVGCDIGTSSVAVAAEKNVLLSNLADKIMPPDDVHRTIRLLQRKLDRSKRATNPSYFRPDGTIIKGKKEWVYSNRYEKMKQKLAELHRKLALYRKLSHHQMANDLLPFGNEVYIEDMNFSALQKRANKTKKSEKTGKFQKKKRFGKSIAHRAPALFVSIWKKKVKQEGGSFEKVNTWTFKASQFDHTTEECVKKPLSERWHTFKDGTKIQRDLYSAFLLQNANSTKEKPCTERCRESFEIFKQCHDCEIEQQQNGPIMVLNSGIRLKA